MDEIHIFLKGLVIGLSIAVPVGPIGILCIRRTLVQGRITGFLNGVAYFWRVYRYLTGIVQF